MRELLYFLTTFSFEYPALLLAPMLVLFLRRFSPGRSSRVLFSDLKILKSVGRSLRLRLRKPLLGGLAAFFVLALSLAAARPVKTGLPGEEVESHNIMLVLDISRSMSASDFQVAGRPATRMEAVKMVVREFIAARRNDRLGLVVFGSNAFLQCPLTLDHSLLADLLKRIQIGMAGDATAMGDGLGIALKRMRDLEGRSKAIILLTDGVSNAGQVNPLKAAQVAADLGIKVHTIGIGSDRPVSLAVPGGFLAQRTLARVEFDEETLRKIAETTGGVYFNAESLEGLQEVYREIDRLEKIKMEDPGHRRVEEFFARYAAWALLAYVMYTAASRSVFLKIP